MSIKIEGGGSKENIFSDSENGIPLWNGEPLLNFVYPVGSLYWSSNNTDPGTLFGGTWQQIKDMFVLAAGDSYSVNSTGGEKTHTLTIDEIPSHDHSFTPSGSVEVTTNPTFIGSAVNTGGMNTNSAGSLNAYLHNRNAILWNNATGAFSSTIKNGGSYCYGTNGTWWVSEGGYDNVILDVSHIHSVTAKGSISGGVYSFSGTTGTTGSRGSGTAHNNMPPYIVKYCWERIA